MNRKRISWAIILLFACGSLLSFQNCAPSGGFSSEVLNSSSPSSNSTGNSEPSPAPTTPAPQPQPSPQPAPTPSPSPVPAPMPPPNAGSAVTPTYYVDSSHPKASDSNAGTSADLPWKSLAAVNSKKFSPGDVIGFKTGTSYSGGLKITSSGTNSQPILFTSYGDGTAPVFSNSGIYSACVDVQASYVILEKFKLTTADETGVRLSAAAKFNVVRDNEMTNLGSGVEVLGSSNLFLRNSIHDLKMIRNTQGGDDDYGANGFIISGPQNEFAFNRCEKCIAPSYDYGTDGGMFELYGTTDDTFIHHNICVDSDGFFEVGGATGATSRNVRMAYNEVINSRFGGIHAAGTFASAVSNWHIENNTIVDLIVRNPRISTLFWVDGSVPVDVVNFQNNIVSARSFQNIFQQNISRSNNLYQLLDGTTGLVGGSKTLSSGELLKDPLFANPTQLDFHLQSNSPAIDQGLKFNQTIDLDQKPISGAAPDLGAFEF